MDEEILQDFIVEAGEIIEKLDEQLVQIEKTPDDKELLNAIFRGFHTIKGGAGFLQLNPLVEVCHAAESLFDELRNGRVSMSSELMMRSQPCSKTLKTEKHFLNLLLILLKDCMLWLQVRQHLKHKRHLR